MGSTYRSGPVLGPVINAEDLDRFPSDSIDEDVGPTWEEQFSGVGDAAFAASVRHVFQRVCGVKDRLRNFSGVGGAVTPDVTGDLVEVLRGGGRPANDHVVVYVLADQAGESRLEGCFYFGPD